MSAFEGMVLVYTVDKDGNKSIELAAEESVSEISRKPTDSVKVIGHKGVERSDLSVNVSA